MITRWYEIICDYCEAAIAHELGSVKNAEYMLEKRGGLKKGKHHFCDETCYQAWLANNRKSVID